MRVGTVEVVEPDLRGRAVMSLAGAARAFDVRVGRGLGVAMRGIGAVFSHEIVATTTLSSGATVAFDLTDHYWATAALRGWYEPDVQWALETLLPGRRAFIDCGANIGWWSAFACTSSISTRVIAVEANRALAPWLRLNAEANQPGFAVVIGAVWSESDVPLWLKTSPRRHAQSSVVRRPTSDDVEVQSVTIDDLCPSDVNGSVLIKLDVEGAEIAALSGAPRVLAQPDVAVIYEDHGRDPDCEPTQWLLERGFAVYALAPGRCTPVHSVDDALRHKGDPRRGYNFCSMRPGMAAPRFGS